MLQPLIKWLLHAAARQSEKTLIAWFETRLFAPGCEARCPGCSHRGLSEEESLARKQSRLLRPLAPWIERTLPVRSPPASLRESYRDKVCLSASWNGQFWDLGLLDRDETVVAIPQCPIHTERVRRLVAYFQHLLPAPPAFPLVFLAVSGQQGTLVLKTPRVPDCPWLNESVQKDLSELGLEGLWVDCNPSAGRRVFSNKKGTLLWGSETSRSSEGHAYGPRTFRQLIAPLHQEVTEKVGQFLNVQAGDSVIDLYSGLGASLSRWTQEGANAIGIELCGEAVRMARQNAPRALSLQGRCSDRIPQLKEWILKQRSTPLLFVNPPRTGLEIEVIQWISAELKPQRMAYLSCSPGTLGRDLEILCMSGEFAVHQIIPYDFFPQTHHVEALALIDRVDLG